MINFTTPHLFRKCIAQTSAASSLKSSIMHPQREWAFGLTAAIILLIGVGIHSIYSYRNADAALDVTTEPINTVVPYRAALIDEALEKYRNLENQYSSLSQTSSVVPDVSSEVHATTTDQLNTATTTEIMETDFIDSAPTPSLAI